MDWLNYHHLNYFSVLAREVTIRARRSDDSCPDDSCPAPRFEPKNFLPLPLEAFSLLE